MAEQGLTNRFDRQKCLEIFREGWLDIMLRQWTYAHGTSVT
jgi:hypothetical protein